MRTLFDEFALCFIEALGAGFIVSLISAYYAYSMQSTFYTSIITTIISLIGN